MSKALITKLTADDPTDPSGFLLKELSGYTHHSASECQSIYEQLLQRLKSTKPDVKYRTLRTIKYLLTNGSRDLRQLFQRNNNDIRALVGYRCEPDPLRGDSIFLRVSAEAKETVSAIFNVPEASNEQQNGSRRFEGYSSNGNASDTSDSGWGMPSNAAPYSSSSSNGASSSFRDEYSSGGSKYAGYGSSAPSSDARPTGRQPRVSRYSSGNGLVGKLQSTASVIADVVSQQVQSSQFASNVLDRVSKHLPAGVASSMRGNTNNSERDYPSSSFHSFGSNGQYHAPTISDDRSSDRYTSNNNSNSYRSSVSSFPASTSGAWGRQNQPATVNGTASSASTSVQPAGITASTGDGALESKLVDQLTTASGVKTTPSQAEMQHFLTTAEPLDLDRIAELLNDKLQGLQVFVTKMKALAVIQHAIDQQSALGDVIFNYFNDHAQHLEQLESSTNAQVKSRATLLMQKLGMREGSAGSEHTDVVASSANTSPSKTDNDPPPSKLDLLNFASDEQSSSSQPPPATSDNFDLFAQLQQPSSTIPVKSAATSAAGFDFMGDSTPVSSASSANTSNQTHASANDIDHMFGNLDVKQSQPTQPTSQSTTASAASFDFMQSPTAAAKSTHTDLLSFADFTPSLLDQQHTSSAPTDALSSLLASGKSSTAHLQQHQQQQQNHPRTSQPFIVAASSNPAPPARQASNDPFDFMGASTIAAQPTPQLPHPQQQQQPPARASNAGFNLASPSTNSQQKSDSFSFLIDDMLK